MANVAQNIELVPLLLLICGILFLVLIFWVIRLEIKLRRFTTGKNGANLEASMLSLKEGHAELLRFKNAMGVHLRSVEIRLARSVQSTETLRFNPFQGDGSGGNQSFATALVDQSGNGVVLSSIYARDRMCIFAKPLKQFASHHELSEEERSVVEKAKHSLTDKNQ